MQTVNLMISYLYCETRFEMKIEVYEQKIKGKSADLESLPSQHRFGISWSTYSLLCLLIQRKNDQ